MSTSACRSTNTFGTTTGDTVSITPEKYPEYQSKASDELDKLFVQLLKNNRAQASDEEVQEHRPLTAVLGHFFTKKADRDDIKEIVEREGGRWVLVYFEISEKNTSNPRTRDEKKTQENVESGSCDGDNALEGRKVSNTPSVTSKFRGAGEKF